jgi:hypothetical protein
LDINNYVSFLKLKKSELSAFVKLTKENDGLCTPFFDIPKSEEETEEAIKGKVDLSYRQMKAAQDKAYFPFVIDIYDLDEDVLIEKTHLYDYVLETFSDLDCSPVIGLDRTENHNRAVIDRVDNFDTIFVRVDSSEFSAPRTLTEELEDLVSEIPSHIDLALIIDFRVQLDLESFDQEINLEDFFTLISESKITFNYFILTSSSIPKSISELLKPHSELRKKRVEWVLWEKYRELGLVYGDYGVVSPEYSDADIAPEIMYDVQTPKIIYTDERELYVVRGGGMRRFGTGQFFDLAEKVINVDFFRAYYCEAEEYIEKVAKRENLVYKPRRGKVPSCGGASKWVEVTTLAHITYMGRLLS